MSAQDRAREGVDRMMGEAQDRQRANPERTTPAPTIVKEISVAGPVQTGVDENNQAWAMQESTNLLLWSDGTVTWRG